MKCIGLLPKLSNAVPSPTIRRHEMETYIVFAIVLLAAITLAAVKVILGEGKR
jgi:hypothetical protein